MLRRRDTLQKSRKSQQVIEVGLDELFWPGVSTPDDPDLHSDAGQQAPSDPDFLVDAGKQTKEPEPAGASFGVAFFGWLVASGTSVLLMALVAAVCTLIGWNTMVDWSRGWFFVGLWTVLVLALGIGAFSGGYASGRMVPTRGARQGLEVWVFSWCAAAVLGGLGYLAARKYDLAVNVDVPAVPVAEGDRPRAAVIAVAAILLVTLVGAVLGGATGNKK